MALEACSGEYVAQSAIEMMEAMRAAPADVGAYEIAPVAQQQPIEIDQPDSSGNLVDFYV